MSRQDGTLTSAQFEIMRLLWDSAAGLTVAEIWTAVRQRREVSRTTVLNLVDRLEKRNWLRREKHEGLFRYFANVDRETTEAKLSAEFVGEYFDGSPASFLLSLLGSQKISASEIRQLKSLLAKQADSESSNSQE